MLLRAEPEDCTIPFIGLECLVASSLVSGPEKSSLDAILDKNIG